MVAASHPNVLQPWQQKWQYGCSIHLQCLKLSSWTWKHFEHWNILNLKTFWTWKHFECKTHYNCKFCNFDFGLFKVTVAGQIPSTACRQLLPFTMFVLSGFLASLFLLLVFLGFQLVLLWCAIFVLLLPVSHSWSSSSSFTSAYPTGINMCRMQLLDMCTGATNVSH